MMSDTGGVGLCFAIVLFCAVVVTHIHQLTWAIKEFRANVGSGYLSA